MLVTRTGHLAMSYHWLGPKSYWVSRAYGEKLVKQKQVLSRQCVHFLNEINYQAYIVFNSCPHGNSCGY